MTKSKRLSAIALSPKLTKFLLLLVLFLGAAMIVVLVDQVNRGGLLRGFDHFVTNQGSIYRQWFRQQNTSNLLVLLLLSFGGGLIASISPCILSLLPVNLSYIGTRDITSRWDAFTKASTFVLGVVTVLSLFGLFSSLQGLVLIRYQGYFQVAVGLLIILMGLSLAGIVRLPLPQFAIAPTPSPETQLNASPGQPFSWRQVSQRFLTGPYGVGVTFALVSSPCTSPVTFAILGAAAATGSPWQSTLIMVSYSLGYTAIIFVASLVAGFAKQTHVLLIHSETITRIASWIMLLTGGFYLLNGSRWVVSSLSLAS